MIATPAEIAALRVAVTVHTDQPGTLSSLLARLERMWRDGEQRRQQLNAQHQHQQEAQQHA